MKIDPSSELNYRIKLSLKYLERAEKFFNTGDYKESVEASQLSVENAAKAVISLRRLPSWSHDPSDELLEVAKELPNSERALAEELASIAHALAPEHGISTYGKPEKGLTPWEIYDEEKARDALEKARRARSIMESIIKRRNVEGF
ncbi:MAG: HEPN domain-containing protein [Candidatus Methanodesulfokora sp.]